MAWTLSDIRTAWQLHHGTPYRVYLHDRDDWEMEKFCGTQEEALLVLEDLASAPLTSSRLRQLGFGQCSGPISIEGARSLA